MDLKICILFLAILELISDTSAMNTITICTGPSCTRNFSKDIISTAEEKLNCTIDKSDGKIQLKSRQCFTNCQDGPSVSVNQKLLCQVTPKEMAFLIKTMKKKDQETLDSLLEEAVQID